MTFYISTHVLQCITTFQLCFMKNVLTNEHTMILCQARKFPKANTTIQISLNSIDPYLEKLPQKTEQLRFCGTWCRYYKQTRTYNGQKYASSTDLCCCKVVCYVIVNISTTCNMSTMQTRLHDTTSFQY